VKIRIALQILHPPRWFQLWIPPADILIVETHTTALDHRIVVDRFSATATGSCPGHGFPASPLLLAFAGFKKIFASHHPRLEAVGPLLRSTKKREQRHERGSEQLNSVCRCWSTCQRHNWVGYHVGAGDEFVGLCRCIRIRSLRSISMPAELFYVTAVTAVAI